MEETLRTSQEEEHDSNQGLSRATTTHSPGHVGTYRHKYYRFSLPSFTRSRCSCIYVRVFGCPRSAGTWDTSDIASRRTGASPISDAKSSLPHDHHLYVFTRGLAAYWWQYALPLHLWRNVEDRMGH